MHRNITIALSSAILACSLTLTLPIGAARAADAGEPAAAGAPATAGDPAAAGEPAPAGDPSPPDASVHAAKPAEPAEPAEPNDSAGSQRVKLGLAVGVKGSLGIPQPFSELETGGGVELEIGYLLPFLGRRLGLSASLSYGHHGASGQGEDPRLVPDGTYDWELTYQELMLSFGVTGRIFPPYSKLANGYLTVGPRLFFLQITEEASSGQESFGTHVEQDLRVGVFVALGGEFYLGPGALFLEAEYAWVEVDELITGDADGSALRFLLGYRILM